MKSPALDADIIIVGAGFSGIGVARQLLDAGHTSFLILERGKTWGGTWRDNTYPGAACDVPAPLYSYRDMPNPNWSTLYASQGEILRYLEDGANRANLKDKARFGEDVHECRFDDEKALWTLKSATGKVFCCRYLVLAQGFLANPKQPSFVESSVKSSSFDGEVVHSSRWPKNLSLKGKHVAIVGTGASAIQIGPKIACEVESLTIYQRSPPWIFPKFDWQIPKALRRSRLATIGMHLLRTAIFLGREIQAPLVISKHWMPKIVATLVARAYLFLKVRDQELRRSVTPRYPFGCKRVLLTSDWYEMLQRENVSLICREFTGLGTEGRKAEHQNRVPFDVVICATGFERPASEFPIAVFGKNGTELREEWREQATAYRGCCVSGFPNMFLILGPCSGSGHTSVMLAAEAQISFLIGAITHAQYGGFNWLEVSSDAQERYCRTLRRNAQSTVWVNAACSSWYFNAGGVNDAIFPGSMTRFIRSVSPLQPHDMIWKI